MKTFKVYFHGEEDVIYESASEKGFSDKECKNLIDAAYEVGVCMTLDDDGNVINLYIDND